MIIVWANWAVHKNSFEAWEMIWASTIESIAHLEGFAKKTFTIPSLSSRPVAELCLILSATVYFLDSLS